MLLDGLVMMVSKVRRVKKVLMEIALKERKVIRVRKERKEKRVRKDKREKRVRKERRD